MLCDNIEPNLNISRFATDIVHTYVKITYNTKMNHIMVSLPDYYNSIFIDRFPYKHKSWQLHGILIIPVQMSLFSLHIQKVNFSA